MGGGGLPPCSPAASRDQPLRTRGVSGPPFPRESDSSKLRYFPPSIGPCSYFLIFSSSLIFTLRQRFRTLQNKGPRQTKHSGNHWLTARAPAYHASPPANQRRPCQTRPRWRFPYTRRKMFCLLSLYLNYVLTQIPCEMPGFVSHPSASHILCFV